MQPRAGRTTRLRAWGGWGSIVDAASLAIAAPVVVLPRAALTPLLLAVPAAWGFRRWRGEKWLDATPLNTPLILLAVMMLVSLYATYSIGQSLSKIAGLVFSIGVFFAVVRFGGKRRSWRWALGVFLALESAVAIIGLLGANLPNKLSVLATIAKQIPSLAISFPGAPEGFHPNEVAGVLLWGGPPALAAVALALSTLRPGEARRRRWNLVLLAIVSLLAVILIWGTLVLTQSRSAWIGAAVALLGIAAVLVNNRLPFRRSVRSRSGRQSWLSPWRLLCGSAPGSSNDASGSEVLASASGRTLSVATLQGRIEIWSRAVYGIEDFPLTGMGMNTFRKIVPVLYPLFTISPDFDIAHAHNQLLQAALDLGLPGLVAYLSIWLVAGVCLWRVWWGSEC